MFIVLRKSPSIQVTTRGAFAPARSLCFGLSLSLAVVLAGCRERYVLISFAEFRQYMCSLPATRRSEIISSMDIIHGDQYANEVIPDGPLPPLLAAPSRKGRVVDGQTTTASNK